MKQNNKIISISAAVVALVAVVGLSMASFAQTNDISTSDTFKGPGAGKFGNHYTMTDEEREDWEMEREARREEMEANREKMEAAIENGYNAWTEAIKETRGEDAPILNEVTAENFSAFQTAHGLMEDAHGLMDQARDILEEAGINHPGMGMGGFGGPGGRGMGMHRMR